MLKVGSTPAPGLCVHARPLSVFCQSKGFGKPRKEAARRPEKVCLSFKTVDVQLYSPVHTWQL